MMPSVHLLVPTASPMEELARATSFTKTEALFVLQYAECAAETLLCHIQVLDNIYWLNGSHSGGRRKQDALLSTIRGGPKRLSWLL